MDAVELDQTTLHIFPDLSVKSKVIKHPSFLKMCEAILPRLNVLSFIESPVYKAGGTCISLSSPKSNLLFVFHSSVAGSASAIKLES